MQTHTKKLKAAVLDSQVVTLVDGKHTIILLLILVEDYQEIGSSHTSRV